MAMTLNGARGTTSGSSRRTSRMKRTCSPSVAAEDAARSCSSLSAAVVAASCALYQAPLTLTHREFWSAQIS